jgi:hypothetical protein
MFILFITSLLFEVIRSLFFAYIIRRLTRNDVYGLYTLILYFTYQIAGNIIPMFLWMPFVVDVSLFLISFLIYSYMFKLFRFTFKSKLKPLPLDIYTISYDRMILHTLSALFIVLFIFIQLIGGPFNSIFIVIIIISLLFYVIFIQKRDQKATSHIIIRIGKDTYTYQSKALDLKIKKYAYTDFFKSDVYQLDLIAKVIYRKEKLVRYDYIYALKSSVTTCFDGYEMSNVPYQEMLDELKHYQLVKIYVTDTSFSIKRIK